MADYVLDKGYPVLTTYNGSAVAGVVAYRVVKWVTSGNGGIDMCTDATATTLQLGVVQEAIDQVKVATAKAMANVRIFGTTWVFVNAGAGAITIGQRVMCGANGGVIPAATTGSKVLGICVGATSATGTISPGDLINVALTPNTLF